MPINYDELMALKNLGQRFSYGDREVMLYAYGIGMGADPMDEKELAFVNEAAAIPRPLKVVPTFASVAAWGASPGEMNLNRVMVVDGERDITFHRPLPDAEKLLVDSRVLAVFDKGKDKGAVIRHQTVLKSEKGEELATLVASRFARGDGGFGGPSEGRPSRTRCLRARRINPSTFRRVPIRRWSIVCAVTAIRCTPILNSPGAPDSHSRSCTACAPSALPAAASCRPTPITIPRPSGSTPRGFPHRSIPARP